MSELQEYQHGLKNILFPIAHNRMHRDSQNTDIHVAYSIEDTKLRKFLHYWYIFQTTQDFDFTWYRQCNEYLNSLHPSDKYRIRCYSKVSDEIVNAYLRNPEGFLHLPFSELFHRMQEDSLYFFLPDLERDVFDVSGKITENQRVRDLLAGSHISNMIDLVPFVQRYVDHLRRILQGAPRLSQDILVFRGVKSDYLSDDVGVFRGFSSTTWYPRVAYEFGEDSNMIYEFMVAKETPALCIHSLSEHEEYEVLLDTDIYGVADREYRKYYLDLYPGIGEFPAEHMWDPDATDVEGPDKRITIHSRMVLVHPDADAIRGGREKNRGSILRSRSTRKSTRKSFRKSVRSVAMFDLKDPSSATFVPTHAPLLLRKLREYQLANPRNKFAYQGK
jgi:hypothetical protein